jgi:DNA polymerase III alpha subunit
VDQPCSLHTHSWYSLLEGVSSPDALLARAAACGYVSLALTDTNNLYGAVQFVEAARRHGVRPLLGACLRQHCAHCVALVAEAAGWPSLCRILTRLHLLRDVRLTELLQANAAGLHVLVDDLATAEALWDAFAKRLWLEIVRPGPGHRERHVNARREAELLEGGRRLGLRPVASTAAHFATSADYPAFRVATAVRRGGLLDQLPRALPVTPRRADGSRRCGAAAGRPAPAARRRRPAHLRESPTDGDARRCPLAGHRG